MSLNKHFFYTLGKKLILSLLVLLVLGLLLLYVARKDEEKPPPVDMQVRLSEVMRDKGQFCVSKIDGRTKMQFSSSVLGDDIFSEVDK